MSAAKSATKTRLSATSEEVGEQLLQSIREMKAGLRGRVHLSEDQENGVKKASKPKFDLAELVARIPKDYQPYEDSWDRRRERGVTDFASPQ